MNDLNRAFQDRNDKIQKVVSYITRTQDLFNQFGSDELKAIKDNFVPLLEGVKSEKVRMVVIGEFSRGKSRLVNALLGIDLLPSAKEATTAINTFLQSPPANAPHEKYIQLNFIEPSKPVKTLLWTDDNVLKKWGTELDANNKDARLELQSIDVFMHHDLLDKGLVVIDTPGLESVVAHHKEITLNAIAKSHIAIWVQSVDMLGGNQHEWNFLKETVRQHFRKFLTVVNMWDKVLDPEDDHDRQKPEEQRNREKLDVVKNNFRASLGNDVSAADLEMMTDEKHLMGVSAKWAVENNGANRHRSNIDKLISRIADLCTSGEAQEEIYYKPLQSLASMQKQFYAMLVDELHVLEEARDVQEQQHELNLLEQEIKNQELEQRQTATEFREEHHRVANTISKQINENLVLPLKSLKNELEIILTDDYIRAEVNSGSKNIGLPTAMEEKFQTVTQSVLQEWQENKQQLEQHLHNLRVDYLEAMKEHGTKLSESLGGFQIDIPEIKIDLKVNLSGVMEYQSKKMELEKKLQETEAEFEKAQLEASQLSGENRRLKSVQSAYERARQDYKDLGPQPSPRQYQETVTVSHFFDFLWDKREVRTRYDDSNVKAYNEEKNEIKQELFNREKELEKLIAEEEKRSQQRQSAEVTRMKAEQRLAKLEKELKAKEAGLKEEREKLIKSSLNTLRKATIGELDSRIQYLEKNATKMVEQVFEDQLTELLRCVEEQFMQPLRAKQAKREEVLQLFEQGKQVAEKRKSELLQAQLDLDEVMELTKIALMG